jgi:flavin reductase (DIM6/NTAB) family NADH-FMN oxidoreductase RutF
MDPPLALVCVAKTLPAHTIISAERAFAVNILGAHQLEVALRFAGLKPELPDRFEGLAWTAGVTGAPLLDGSIASLDCRLHASHPGGDHTIFVGEVVGATMGNDREPLLYHSRGWHRPEALPSAGRADDVTRT